MVQAIGLLAGEFVSQHPTYSSRVALHLLDNVMVLPATRRVAAVAVPACQSFDHPLLKGKHSSLSVLQPRCDVKEDQGFQMLSPV